MKLFNNPEFVKNPGAGDRQSDGTFLHEDQVFERIAQTHTPPTIWAQNKEFIKSTVQTITNFAPISINILDYWNKEELYAVCVPNNPKELEKINRNKHIPEPDKGFFINAILGLQEKMAEVYMNNFYTVALKTRNSHNLRTSLMHIFKRYDIDITKMDEKRLLFRNVNALFYEPRFLTNKEYNLKKGKSITFKYATLAAWEAKIEGALASDTFFCEYKDKGTFRYEVNSVILREVYDAFVKPLAHPLGMAGYYTKICKTDLSDKVMGLIVWTADAVTVRCRNESDTLPIPAPPMLLPYKHNPKYGPDVEVYGQNLPDTNWSLIDPEEYMVDFEGNENELSEQVTIVTFLEPRKENDRIRIIGDPTGSADEYIFTSNDEQKVFKINQGYPFKYPNEPKWVHDLPYPSAIPNDEHIKINENITDANHPNNPLPNIVFATWDGYKLDKLIKDIDEGQGNILQSIEHGYGTEEYSGYTFNKYIFRNGAYLIEYECQKESGEYERLIEYYRYDSFDMSIHQNTINVTKPTTIYPIPRTTNIVNGILEDIDPADQDPLSGLNPFGFDNVRISDPDNPDSIDPNGAYLQPYGPYTNLGLDMGVWTPLPMGYPTSESSYVTINEIGGVEVLPHNLEPVAIQAYNTHIQREEAMLMPGVDYYETNIPYVVGINESYAVYVDGLRQFPEISIPDPQGGPDIIVYPADFTLSVDSVTNKATIHFTNLSYGVHYIDVVQEVPEISVTYPEVRDPDDPSIIIRPEQTNVISEGTHYEAVKLTQEMVDNYKIPVNERTYNLSVFHNHLLVPGWMYHKDVDSPSIVFRREYELNVDDVLVFVWQPDPVKTRHHQAKVDDKFRDDYFPVAQPPLEDYMSKKFYIQLEFFNDNVLLFTEGKLRRKATYDITKAENEWTVPRTPIVWDVNTNIVNTLWRFIPIYTLVGRFIQTRGCKVNTFNLKETELPSIREDFLVKLICYNKNITHFTYDKDGQEIVTNVVHYIDDDINTPDVIDQKPRTPGTVYSNTTKVDVNITNSAKKLIRRP